MCWNFCTEFLTQDTSPPLVPGSNTYYTVPSGLVLRDRRSKFMHPLEGVEKA